MTAHSNAGIYILPLPTPDGEFLARYSLKGLCALEFPQPPAQANPSEASAQVPAGIRNWHAITAWALAAALAGQTPRELPPLDLSAGTAFQQQVWQVLCRIACGQTWSYGQVAQAIGQPRAVRAVGGACGANPIPVLVPCHRVLAANRRLGGFSGGLDWKRKLLAREGNCLGDLASWGNQKSEIRSAKSETIPNHEWTPMNTNGENPGAWGD